MAFRDDHDAALQRAAALERELAAAREQLEERDQELDRVQDQLEKARAELEAEAESEREDPAARARAQLDALVDEGEELRARRATKAAEGRARDERRALTRASRADQIRLWRSVLWAGMLSLSPGILLLAVPVAFVLGGLVTLVLDIGRWAHVAVYLALTLTPLPYAWLKLTWLRRWARTRPYELRGYPELLTAKPRSRDVDSSYGSDDGHRRLAVVLRFAGRPPGDLGRILRAFDEQLAGSGEDYARPSPITEVHSKHGSRWDNADTNWEVHAWIRRLERKVLRDLHRVSPLESVTVQLS